MNTSPETVPQTGFQSAIEQEISLGRTNAPYDMRMLAAIRSNERFSGTGITDLGILVTDINMQGPEGKLAITLEIDIVKFERNIGDF